MLTYRLCGLTPYCFPKMKDYALTHSWDLQLNLNLCVLSIFQALKLFVHYHICDLVDAYTPSHWSGTAEGVIKGIASREN